MRRLRHRRWRAASPVFLVACAVLLLLAATPALSAVSGEGTRELEKKRKKPRLFKVEKVIDGDTIRLTNGETVRLVQIDAPESPEECYGDESTAVLEALLPKGTKVKLQSDQALDKTDDFGRLLRYVIKGKKNINIALVNKGAATVWFYEGDRGKFANKLLAKAQAAFDAGKGLWGACPGTPFDPLNPAETGQAQDQPEPPHDEPQPPAPSPACSDGADNDGDGNTDYPDDPGCESASDTDEIDPAPPGSCDPAYPTVCIPPPPPDLNCGDIPHKNFMVLPPDPHRFDSDKDGIGCET